MNYIYCNCSKNEAEYRTIKILVVDDDKETQKMFAEKLFKKYEIEVVPDAAGCLSQCLSRTFDLILLSEDKLKLTESNKLKLLRTLRKLTLKIPPVFLLTKNLEKEVNCDEIFGLIQKPINQFDIYNFLEFIRKNPSYSIKKFI